MRRAATALLLLATAGCHTLTVRSGREVNPVPADGHDARWVSAIVGGVVEVDKPTRLDLLCKETGWAEVEIHRSPINWLVDTFLARAFYESETLTLHCAKAPAPPASAPRSP